MHPPWEMTIDRPRSSTFLTYMLLHDVREDYHEPARCTVVHGPKLALRGVTSHLVTDMCMYSTQSLE
jgi:hypothetical protein